MSNYLRETTPQFSSSDEKISYLEQKILFLLAHAEQLADRNITENLLNMNIQLKELQDMKNSKSWRITRPLREFNRILKIWRVR